MSMYTNEPLLPPQQVQAFMQQPHFPMYPLQPGQFPQVQVQVQFPPALQQLAGNILYHAINASQLEARNGPLRSLHFNMLAQNNWNNEFFAFFLANLMDAVQAALMVNQVQGREQPDAVIARLASQYAQFRTAKNAFTYQLLGLFQPDFQAACHQAVQGWTTMMANIMNQAAQMQQGQPMGMGYPGGQGGYGGQQPGYGYPGQQQQQGYGMPGGGGGYGGMPNTGMMGAQAARGGYSSFQPDPNASRFSSPGQPVRTAPVTSVTQPVNATSPSGWRSTNDPINSGTSSGPINSTPEPTFRSPMGRAAAPAQPPSAPPPPAPAAATTTTDRQVYDVNLFEPELILTSEGTTTTRLRSLPPMDRDQHLRRPGYTPPWIKTPKVVERETRIDEAKKIEPQGPVFEVIEIKEGQSQPCLDRTELWAKLSLGVQQLQRTQSKIRALAGMAGQLKPIKTSPAFPVAVDQIKDSPDLETAATTLRQVVANAGDDVQAFEEVDCRLTASINDILSKELQLDVTIDSFRDDMGALMQLLASKYGSSVTDIFTERTQRILALSLQMYKPSDNDIEQTYYESLVDAYLEDVVPEDDRKNLFAVFFSESLLLVAIDMSSVELGLAIADGAVASLLQASNAPLGYELVHAIMQRPSVDKAGKVLMRTNDNVIIEINRGALNPEAYLLSLSK